MEAIEATCVNAVSEGRFDDPVFSNLKEMTQEELLSKTIELIEDFAFKEGNMDHKEVMLFKVKNKDRIQNLVLLLGERYRRNTGPNIDFVHRLMTFIEDDHCVICKETKVDYFFDKGTLFLLGKYAGVSNLVCSPCKINHSSNNTIETVALTLIEQHKGFLEGRQVQMYVELKQQMKGMEDWCKTELRQSQMVKEAMLKILKTPILTKQLEERMDEILDLNGNKISQMKDYLTEEQYRFVRSGNRFEEFPKQQELLENFNKMLDALKGKC